MVSWSQISPRTLTHSHCEGGFHSVPLLFTGFSFKTYLKTYLKTYVKCLLKDLVNANTDGGDWPQRPQRPQRPSSPPASTQESVLSGFSCSAAIVKAGEANKSSEAVRPKLRQQHLQPPLWSGKKRVRRRKDSRCHTKTICTQTESDAGSEGKGQPKVSHASLLHSCH